MEGHLIVGHDGSVVSRAAARWAVDEAARRSVGLTIVGCFVEPAMSDLAPASEMPGPRHLEATRATTQQHLDDLAIELRARRPEVAVNACAVPVTPRRGLADLAAHADLLVIGSTGHGRSSRYLWGSTAQAMTRHSPCPVVLVAADRPPAERPRVILLVDSTVGTGPALAWACDEAELLEARLDVLYLWSPPDAHPDGPSEDGDLARVDAARQLDRTVERARDRCGVDVEGRLITAETVSAGALDADMVVVGSVRHPRSFRLVPSRSVSDTAITHAACPVVIVADQDVASASRTTARDRGTRAEPVAGE